MEFSVLMSLYYKETNQNLDECLYSIIENQTLKANEIVLVIDGEIGDELWDVINKYRERYELFKIVELKENVGLGKALNIGMKECSFKYIARMDTDDIASKNRFEKQIDFLVKNPEVAVLGSNILEFSDDPKNIVSEKKQPLSYGEIKKYSKRRNPINHPTVIFDKEVIVEAGGYKPMESFEDYYLWLRVLAKGYLIKNIGENLVYMRVSNGLYSRRGGLAYVKRIIRFRNACLKNDLISLKNYLLIVPIQIFVACLPLKLREIFFWKVLRNQQS